MKRIMQFFRAVRLVLKHGEEGIFKDPLTGCYSRRLLEEIAEREINMAQRYEHKLCLIIADVDGLKKINDENGHLEGDKALKKIAEVFKQESRKTDLIFRWGGDEFIIVMPDTSKFGPQRFIEKVSKELDKFSLSVSMGYVFWEKGLNLDTLIHVADLKLLEKKKIKKAQI